LVVADPVMPCRFVRSKCYIWGNSNPTIYKTHMAVAPGVTRPPCSQYIKTPARQEGYGASARDQGIKGEHAPSTHKCVHCGLQRLHRSAQGFPLVPAWVRCAYGPLPDHRRASALMWSKRHCGFKVNMTSRWHKGWVKAPSGSGQGEVRGRNAQRSATGRFATRS
jgi:ribosomal protein L37AE/L43A